MDFPMVTYSCMLADGTYVLEFSVDSEEKDNRCLNIKEYNSSSMISKRTVDLDINDTGELLNGLAISRIHPGAVDIVTEGFVTNDRESIMFNQRNHKQLVAVSYIHEHGEFKYKLSYWLVKRGRSSYGIEISSSNSRVTEISDEYILFGREKDALDFIDQCARNFVFPYSLEEIILDIGLEAYATNY